MKSTIKIAILENYALFSSGLKSLLHASEGIEVIAEGDSSEALILALCNESPHLLLIDAVHCHNAGINTIKEIKVLFPYVPKLMITNQNYSECFKEYLNYGIKGFIFTDDKPEELFSAIKTLSLGNEYFKKNMSKQLLTAVPLSTKTKGRPPKDNPLTAREIDVLNLFCEGLTYKEIGLKLQISPRTVETHKKHIMQKLKVTKRAEMIKYATRYYYVTN